MSCNGMTFFPANSMLHTSQDQQDENNDTHHHHEQSPIFPPQINGVVAFLGGKRSMIHLTENQNGCGETKENNNNVEDELSDDGSLASGDQKNKRLNNEQVRTLEKSFEMGNKLESERKVQLARVLGLQPRQVAIWFQNRRARWKNKQLEKDYDTLKRQFNALKAQNEALRSQNQKLQSQIHALTSERGAASNVVATDSFNLNKETVDQDSCSNRSDNEIENSSDQINMVKLDTPGQIPTSMPLFPTSSSANTNSLRLSSSTNLTVKTQLFFHHNQQQQQHQQQNVKDDNFSNMFCGIEDQSGFWPWLE